MRKQSETKNISEDIISTQYTGFFKELVTFKIRGFHGTRANVISFSPISKSRPSLHRFSRNLPVLNSIMCQPLTQNFIHRKYEWRITLAINKICFNLSEYHETYNNTTNFHEHLLYEMLFKSEENVKNTEKKNLLRL